MNHWTGQNDGSILGAATDRSLEWAGGNLHKLAAIGFVALARDFDLAPIWSNSAWQRVTLHHPLDRPRDVTVLLDSSTDPDRVIVPQGQHDTRYAIVRVLSGSPPVLHFIGLSGILDQVQARFNGSFPRNQLLRLREYLPVDLWRQRNFPEA